MTGHGDATDRGPIADGPVDLSRIAADDALLDALGRGEPARTRDPLAQALAAWRADVDSELPGPMELPADLDAGQRADRPTGAAAPTAHHEPTDTDVAAAHHEPTDTDVAAAHDEPTDTDVAAGTAQPATADGPVTPLRRPGRRVRRLLIGVAAALVVAAGLVVGADHAGPTSPLWPLTRVAFPEHVDARLAEHHIALARKALADGRYADARRYLDRAEANVNRVRNAGLARRLRAAIEALRRTLPPDGPSSEPSPGGTTPPSPAPGRDQQPGGGSPPQQPGGGTGPGIPPVDPPQLPVPTPPLPPVPTPPVPTPPVPTLPVPTLPVPTLPVPTLPI